MPLKSKLKQYAAGVPKALDAAAHETADAILATRNQLVPVDTGELKESGEVRAGEQVGEWVVSEGAGLPDARAAYTEYGTDKQVAQPHMTPAAEQHRGDLARNVGARLKGLEKRAKV